MLQNGFVGKSKRPTRAELSTVLGPSQPLWAQLLKDLKRELKLDQAEWHCYSTKAGWSLRLQLKKRTIVYLAPGQGGFLACFVLGSKAIAAARNSGLPGGALRMIKQSRSYAEGTGVRIEVRSQEDLLAIKILARIKVEN
jgi:hypothetical protein